MNYSTILSALILCVSGFYGSAQVSDDFSDGDFTSNPVWGGDVSQFEVSSGRLNSNGSSSAASVLHLATPSTLMHNTVWEFLLDLGFNGTGTNFVRIYLTSDKENLESNPTGYFIHIGQTNSDFIKLYRNDAGTATEILLGTTAFASNVKFRLKVIRDKSGVWTIYSDPTGGTTYQLEGSVTDNTHSSSSYFGVFFQYSTTSRYNQFHFDDLKINPLLVETISVTSKTSMDVTFNQKVDQTDAETTANYTIAGLTISSATRDASNTAKVALQLDAGTPLTTNSYSLQIGTGLTQNSTTQKDFSYTQLALSNTSTLSSTTFRLTFNDDLKQTIAETTSNYSVDNSIGAPTSAALNGSNSKQVELTFGTAFSDGINYQINLTGIQNSSGNSTVSTTSNFSFVLPLVLQSATTKSENTVLLTFNKSLNQASAETASNYSINNSIGTPSSAVLQSDQKSVLLTAGASFTANTYAVTASNVQDTGSNTISGTDNTASFSYSPLTISSVSQVNSTTLTVTFNQSVEEASSTVASSYSLNNGGTVSTATWSAGTSTQVTLTVSGMANSTYTLTVNGVKNSSGNATASALTKSFDFNKATGLRGIIITEVMADPTVPTGQTPTSYSGEYVELYNPGTIPIRLENFRMNNEKLPVYTLNPSAYVVVVDNSSYSSFSSIITNVIQVANFDALSTPTDSVILRDQYRNLLDSIYYTATWFHDNVKDDGGYSIELISPNLSCSESNNWTATLSSTGGTPGAQNGVYSTIADTTSPTLTSVTVTNSKLLTLVFSEPLDHGTVVTGAFGMNGNTISSVSRTNYSTFKVTLGTDLVSETTNTLNFTGIKDCSGNALSTMSKTFRYDISGPKFKDLVVLSQNQVSLLVHEQLNKAAAEDEQNFKLNGLIPSRALLQDTARYRVQLTFESDFVVGTNYSLVASNLKDTTGNVTASIEKAFTYQSIVDSTEMITGNLAKLHFKEKPKSSTILTSNFLISGNIGNPSSAWIDKDDSTKVLLSLSKNLSENTSYTIYMERIDSKVTGSRLMTPAGRLLYDTKSPTYSSIQIPNDSTLKVTYDEKINVQKALASSLYSLEDGSNPKNVSVSGKNITLTFSNKFPIETAKKLTIQKGITDLFGNVTASSRNIDFTYDPKPPRVLSSLYEGSGVFAFTLNEKLKSGVTTASNYLINATSPTAVSQIGPDSLTFKLSFTGFTESSATPIVLKALTDMAGNVAADTTITLNTLEARVKSLAVKSDSVIEVSFNRVMGSSVSVAANYSLDGSAVKSVATSDNQKVSITLSSHLVDASTHSITFSGIADQSGGNLADSQKSFQVHTYFHSYKFLNAKTLELKFSTSFSAITASSFSLGGVTPQLAQIDGADPTIIRLIFQSSQSENTDLNLIWATLSDTYNRTIPGWKLKVKFDTNAPAVSVINSDFLGVITVVFDEAVDKSSAESVNSWSIVGIGAPGTATLTNATVKLDFNDKLVSGTAYKLVINGVADASGNYLKDTTSFTYTPPDLPKKGDILITEIMADPSPVVGLPDAEYVEVFNASSGSINLKTLKLIDPTTKASLPDYELASGAYVVLIPPGSFSLFSIQNKLSVSGFPSLGNTSDSLVLTTIFNGLIDRVKYDQSWYKDTGKQDGGYSLELINPASKCPSRDNWKASTSTTGGTPGFQNAVHSTNPDQVAPTIKSFSLIGTTGIRINFSESMDSLSLINGSYSLPNITIASAKITDTFGETVQLIFADSISRGVLYDMKVSNVSDCSGNEITTSKITFGLGRTPANGELLITEIMADPDPVVQLPNSEYLELFNNTDDLLSLNGLKLYDATGAVSLGNYSMPAKSYAILVPSASIASFNIYGQVVPVTSWLSLNNTGEQLLIKEGSAIIDRVVYSSSWYKNTNKSDGGYSLELINPGSGCPGSSNWTASNDVKGGTPGAQNSVYSLTPDTTSPIVLITETVTLSQIKITFSESMDSLSLVNGTFTGANLPTPTIQIADANNSSVLLLFNPAPATGIIHKLTISGVSDCSGNSLASTEVTFGLGRAPKWGELLITEIMADPDPVVQLPNSEYLEIYNSSDDLLSLSGVTLNDATGSVNLPAISIGAKAYLILCPSASETQFSLYGSARGISGWLSLTNAGERLSLTYESQVIFSVTYSDEWHEEKEKAGGGYSLEIRDFNNPCGERSNWGASTDSKGGTPGQPNSIQGSVPDNFGPNLLNVLVDSPRELTLTFDEAVHASGTTILITPEIAIADFETSEKAVIVGLSNDLSVNVIYSLTVTGITDCNGNQIQSNTLTFIRPDESVEVGNILLSELLSDPRAGGVDFVEIHNVSDKYIDLKNWKLVREVNGELSTNYSISESQYVIKPGQYVALAADKDRLILDFPQGKSENFIEMSSLPTLPNDEGNVMLLDSSGNEMDRLDYSVEMHSSLLKSTEGVSLERISFNAPTNDFNNWRSASSTVGFGTPGHQNSQSFESPALIGVLGIEPKVFVPGSSSMGMQSFTTINYEFDQAGKFATVTVFDQNGRQVALLASNASLSTSGFFQWDGTDSGGRAVGMGYYVVLFEIYDSTGKKNVMKETVVVGR